MSWEITVGIFTLLSAFISVVTVAVKVNRAIVLLEAAVKRLDEHAAAQREINDELEERIGSLNSRITQFERKRREKIKSE